MRYFSMFLLLFFAECNRPMPKITLSNKKLVHRSYIDLLKIKKAHIDSLRSDKEKLIVLVKLPNSDRLRIVKKGMFPDSVETTYNIFQDNAGHIVYIMESPYSESGDWDILYSSYFDTDGQLFSFQRIAVFFNSDCTSEVDDAAHEKLVKYFNRRRKLMDSTYTLMDIEKKPLKKSLCTFNYDFPYKIIFRLKDYLKTNKIVLK
jgi:hypothetical protein